MAKLTTRHRLFVDCYLADPDLNAKRAAITAGYSQKSASSIASQLMQRPDIKAAIELEQKERIVRTGVDVDYVIGSLLDAMEMARGNLPVTITKTEDGVDVVKKIKKTNLMAMNRTAELLGKHLGIFVEKQEIEAKHTLEKTIADISKENAANRKSLLPKDNIDFDNE